MVLKWCKTHNSHRRVLLFKMTASGDFSSNRLPETYWAAFHDQTTSGKLKYNALGRTGMHISGLGIGGGGLGGFYGSVDEQEAIEAVRLGVKLGLNYIDTSPWYGDTRSEKILGKALAPIPRNVYYIATKVGRYKPEITEMFDFHADRVIASVDESLQRLGVSYVDLIQVHDFEFAPSVKMILEETLPALEKVRSSGKARFIGLAGYPVQLTLEIVEKSPVKIDTVLSYCRYGIINNDLKDIMPKLKELGVGIINAAPVGMGLLSEKGPPNWHPAEDDLKAACKECVRYGKEHGVKIANVALKHCYASDDIATTLVSMETCELIRSNINVVTSPMTDLEERVRDVVVKNYITPLKETQWEKADLEKYWKQMREKTGHRATDQ